ncbi:MAG TPA: PAS domain-containing protein, partial [Rhizomicrobium sp.]|nr:PAS domain-containing protein [Rhizomicrobium sp.]
MAQQADFNKGMGTRFAIFWLAAGVGLAAIVAFASSGPAPWLLAASLVLFGVALFVGTRDTEAQGPVAAEKSDPALGLPVVAREVFERLPDPIMLVDVTGRVAFANRAMATVAGTDSQNKPVSAVLRTPAVWQAVER